MQRTQESTSWCFRYLFVWCGEVILFFMVDTHTLDSAPPGISPSPRIEGVFDNDHGYHYV